MLYFAFFFRETGTHSRCFNLLLAQGAGLAILPTGSWLSGLMPRTWHVPFPGLACSQGKSLPLVPKPQVQFGADLPFLREVPLGALITLRRRRASCFWWLDSFGWELDSGLRSPGASMAGEELPGTEGQVAPATPGPFPLGPAQTEFGHPH